MTEEPIILIGDRDAESSIHLAQMLRQRKHRVHTVRAGVQALDFIRSHSPAMILLASQLSDMSGLELCRRIRQRDAGRAIPILFMSGDAEEQVESLKAGASDYVSKPVRPT